MAVFRRLEDREIKLIENIYEIEILRIEQIEKGILNSNFLLYTNKNKFVLRVSESNREFLEEKEEVELLEKIKKLLPVPKILKNKNLELISILENKIIVIFHFIEGSSLNGINVENIREIAKYISKFHKFSLKNKMSISKRKTRIDLDFYLEKILESEIDFEKKEEIISEAKKIKKVDFSNLPSGFIHSDIFPDNVLVKNNKIQGIIDFNEFHYAPFIFDIAIILNFWIYIANFNKKLEKKLVRIFILEYSKYRKLLKIEKKFLKLALKRMALTFILLRLYKEKIEKNYENAIYIEKKSYLSLVPLLKNNPKL